MKLVIGLGNPGSQYQNTRHNAGFIAVDKLAGELGVAFSRTLNDAQVARAFFAGFSVLLVKPQTFMNLSGRSVAPIARRYGCEPEEILVLVDDRHLPLGVIRLRSGGGSGGHKGLASIAAELGTADYHRLRLGIGHAATPRGDLSGFVLGRFSQDEMAEVTVMTDQAVQASLCWMEHGIEHAMNRFNARNQTKGE